MSSSEQGSRRKQSRIVIDVDRMQQEAAHKRSRPRLLGRGGRILSVAGLIAAAVILLLGVGGYIWWQSYKKSPAYSLAVLADAAQHNDVKTIEQLIDADRVTRSLVPQVIDKALASVGGMGTLSAPRRQIESALPQLLPYARDQVRAEVANGVKDVAEKTGGRLPFALLALGVPRMWESITDGNEHGEEKETVKTIVFKYGERPVTLEMRQDGERWKITGIKDDELAANIATRVVGSLPINPGTRQQQDNQTRRPARQRQ
ncbi:MAG TPA: DUF2939 domain-containing protein [Pyrinomonadaceae bacterium]|jgi:hypothetical protein